MQTSPAKEGIVRQNFHIFLDFTIKYATRLPIIHVTYHKPMLLIEDIHEKPKLRICNPLSYNLCHVSQANIIDWRIQMKNEDAKWVESILAGDEDAFTALVKKHEKQVHAFVWREGEGLPRR